MITLRLCGGRSGQLNMRSSRLGMKEVVEVHLRRYRVNNQEAVCSKDILVLSIKKSKSLC
jgi:hypothetical protein